MGGVGVADDSSVKELIPFTAGQLSGFSEEAIRAGYIGVAEWLVKCQVVRQAVDRLLLDDAALYQRGRPCGGFLNARHRS